MFVKPAAPHLIIRDPATGFPLPAEGREVPDDSIFWQRRLLENRKFPKLGVVLVDAPARPDASPASPAADKARS